MIGWLTGFGRLVLGVIVGLLVASSAGEALAARALVRWTPTADTRVVGYDVWVRPAGTTYDTAFRPTQLTSHADGSVSTVVDNLVENRSYYVAVSAFTGDGKQSPFSRELGLGPVDPCVVDRCTGKTTCDIRPASDGASCSDDVFCNGEETCRGGVCQPGTARTCSDGIECTTDSCDEQRATCVNVGPPGCCPACYGDDPCFADACAAGECRAEGGLPLTVKKIKIVGTRSGSTMLLQATFTPPADPQPNPMLDGAIFRVQDPSDTVLYHIALPPQRLIQNPRPTNPGFRFVVSRKRAAEFGGVTVFDLKIKKTGVWVVTIKADSTLSPSAFARSDLRWLVRMGDTCVRRIAPPCGALRRTVTVCRD